MKTAIVTAADHAFFGFLSEMLDSLDHCVPGWNQARPNWDPVGLCVLDLGLLAEQRAQLERRSACVVAPGWDLDFPGQAQCKRWYQAMIARPHLPKHFPQYERYIWLDADVWMQDSRALEMLLAASSADYLAIVPELHRSYPYLYNRSTDTWASVTEHYVNSFGEEAGRRYAALPMINVGVFAAKRDLPFWGLWSKRLHEALQRGVGVMLEQCSLCATIYDGQIPIYPLPDWCNWLCSQSVPLLDLQRGLLLDPLAPHDVLSVVHLCSNKDRPTPVPCSDGTTQTLALNYRSMKRPRARSAHES